MTEKIVSGDVGNLGSVPTPAPDSIEAQARALADLSDDDLPIGTVKVVRETGEIVHFDGRDSLDDPDLAQSQAVVDDMDFDGLLSYPTPDDTEAVVHIQAVVIKAQRKAAAAKALLLARLKAQQAVLEKIASKAEATT